MAEVLHFFRKPGDYPRSLARKVSMALPMITNITTETCYNVELVQNSFSKDDKTKFLWLITETFEPNNVLEDTSFLLSINDNNSNNNNSSKVITIIEVGPRLAFTTAWSSNCSSMCLACGITSTGRIERSRRYRIETDNPLTETQKQLFLSLVHDRMTECVYEKPLTSFFNGLVPEEVQEIPVLTQGKQALIDLNNRKGLGFDDYDLELYTTMFRDTLRRNPTDVECFDLGQSNSEHSRHWFFGGKMIIDGEEKQQTLFQMVKSTLQDKSNSVIAFHDNSSAIEGFQVTTLTPKDPSGPSPMQPNTLVYHPILTAETHNFPSGVAPFPGAETGTGGRLRDVQATGRGAHTLAGVSAYCVGNLRNPDNYMPWEVDPSGGLPIATDYPSNLAIPLDIEIEASNGASDYGNKYGEPVVAGYTRSFGQRLPNGERVEWIKPIMFTAGVGMLDSRHSTKGNPEVGMIICKVGGPAYRIGMGGGAASSRTQGTTDAALDFDAVQRGDAEMENRMNRVIRACVEMGENNPIISIHDQGAGGNGNVLKEIVDPLGARLELRNIPLGDPTMSVMEIWGAEYQENNAFLVSPEKLSLVLALGERENCAVSPVGTVTGDGRVCAVAKDGSVPFDLPLSLVLGKMPQKTYHFSTPKPLLKPLELPAGVTAKVALNRVLRLLDVGSKRFLTNKVDRSVTGLIAQQQCVGPLHTPLSDVAVLAQSHFATTGVAVAVGEQPIKGLVDNGAQARMTVGEALTNLMFARITSLSDVKASGNWMWAAKMDGEGAKMYKACEALMHALKELGPGIDGGKDSLSMAAKVSGETVKSPGEITLTCYAACPDITKTITPDLKCPGVSELVYVDLNPGKNRLGGSALSTVYNQIGDEVPDMEDSSLLKKCFECVQKLLDMRLLLAGHDRSDGGLVVTLLEMAFAGNCGISVRLPAAASTYSDHISELFSEELGIVLEILPQNTSRVLELFSSSGLLAYNIGNVTEEKTVQIIVGNDLVINDSMTSLRDAWESTSFSLEMLQCNPSCVKQEQEGLSTRTGIPYRVVFDMNVISLFAPTPPMAISTSPRIAVLRQEGSNGDREMLSAFYAAGFEVWDVNMRDLIASKVTLDKFRGVVFCGGFSYADVNDSAKGWAGVIKFNPKLLDQFNAFRDREDSFSLGVCNGCQLMALLGWVPFPNATLPGSDAQFSESQQARFIHNSSGRYESRWVGIKIMPSAAVLLDGMAGSTLGVWVAHGEGKAYFPNEDHQRIVEENGLAPIRYVDDNNNVTEVYPMNPNGSPNGIAALCSPNGRHLAMMPHPERCFLQWQWPHMPQSWKVPTANSESLKASPWMKLFQNAFDFCNK